MHRHRLIVFSNLPKFADAQTAQAEANEVGKLSALVYDIMEESAGKRCSERARRVAWGNKLLQILF